MTASPENLEKNILYEVVLSDNWGENSGRTVKWVWESLGAVLEGEKEKGKGYWVKSYKKTEEIFNQQLS